MRSAFRKPRLGALVDPSTYVVDHKPTVGMRLARTLEHKILRAGLPLTQNASRLQSIKDRHQGERCFVIGNGPSIRTQDLSMLAGEITFGMNSIYTYREQLGFSPTYYLVEDTLVAEDRAEEINIYRDSVKFFGNHLRYCLTPDEKTTWLNVILDYDPYPGFPKFSRNAVRVVWVGGTVSYLCLQLAFSMGITRVILVGFDHSYEIPSDADIEGNVITSRSADPNHFDESYFGPGRRWHFPRLERMELAYERSRIAFESSGREIVNATDGGALGVFTRASLRSVF